MQAETLVKYEQGELLYNQGLAPKEIGKRLKISVTRFRSWLKDKGYDTGYDCLPLYKLGMEMYMTGEEKSTEKIAKKFKISRKRFADWMKLQGVVITNSSKTHSFDEDYFEKIDTEDKAYWLGFIYADGCICEQKRNNKVKSMVLEIGLQINDKTHLDKFNKSINGDCKITHKTNKLKNKEFESCRITVNSVKICRDLINLGCTPRKSLTLQFPKENQVPKNLIKHFLRGYIDGDGSIMLSTNGRHSRLSILGTKDFLTDMQFRMGWKSNKIYCSGSNGKAYSLEYSGTYTLDYLKNLYENSTIYLDRKYKKFKEIIAVLT
ncbi:hypothetical protein [Clostridium sp. ZBS18]|uniref:hypothetical protein n=1 Tax=Clostridium sp. ZBS18 TaxID=2949967 RepID=UPI00207A7CCB|nr:hypothetical protein [Clostridium sp. ZBS18]